MRVPVLSARTPRPAWYAVVLACLLLSTAPPAAATTDPGAQTARGDRAPSVLSPARAAALAGILDEPRAPVRRLPPGDRTRRVHGSEGTMQRQWTTEATYTDECDDAEGGALDLRRSLILADSHLGGLLAFTATTCAPWSTARLGVVGWRLSVPGGRRDGPDHVVQVTRRADGGLHADVLHTPSDDPDSWSGTALPGAVERSNDHTVTVYVPASLLDGNTSFAFDVVAIDDADRGDGLPQLDRPLVAFPEACDVVTYREAVVTPRPGGYGAAVAALRRAGLDPRVDGRRLRVLLRGIPIAALQRLPDVAAARHLVVYEHQATSPYQTSAGEQWALAQINAAEGWRTRAGSDLVAAVVDDGVDGTRPELAGRVLEGRDLLADSAIPAGANSDLGGHGTAVAGVIAADPGGSSSVRGVDRTARVRPYRVFDAAGCADELSVAEAITHAAGPDTTARRADVVNVSLGGPEPSDAVRDAIRTARDHGLLVVAAAGNLRDAGNPLVYPAAYDEVTAVGATTRSADVASYSGVGPWVDVTAPGGGPDGGILVLGEGGLAEVGGTSFSAPHVAGAVLLYRAEHPGADVGDIERAVGATARDRGPVGHDPFHGAGTLDLAPLLPGDAPHVRAEPPSARQDGPVAVALHPDPPEATVRYTTDGSDPAGGRAYEGPFEVASTTTVRFVATDGQITGPAGDAGYVIGPPAAGISAPGRTAEHRPVTLATGSVPGWSVAWEFADGAIGAGPTVSHTYSSAGAYTATATVSEPDGSWTVAQHVVGVADGAVVARAAGEDRIATAAAVARTHWEGAADVLVATAADFPDALAAGTLAARRGAPLLLTHPHELSAPTRTEVARLQPTTIWVLGGPAAISDQVAAELARYAPVRRLGGATRSETAALVAREAGPSPWGEAVVAFAGNFPDAVSAGALAASPDVVPILLTDTDAVPAETLSALRDLQVTRVIVVGGAAVVSESVVAQLAGAGPEVVRLAGPDRYGTTAAVVQDALPRFPFGSPAIVYATGAAFPDALAAAPLAARLGGPVALVDPTDLGRTPAVADAVRGAAQLLDVGTIVGGPAAVSEAVELQLRDAMTAEP